MQRQQRSTLCIRDFRALAQLEQAQVLRQMMGRRSVVAPLSEWMRRPPVTFRGPLTRDTARQLVEADGRVVSLLPQSFRRCKSIQHEAVLQVVSLGFKGSRALNQQPFMQSLLLNHSKVIPPLEERTKSWMELVDLLGSNWFRLCSLLQIDGRNLGYFPAELRDNPVIAHAAQNADPRFCGLRYASARLRDCSNFMSIAVRRRASLYRLCSYRLRGTELALLRCALNGGFREALCHATPPLKRKREASVAALEATKTLRSFPLDLRANTDHLLDLAGEYGVLIAQGLEPPLTQNALFQLDLVHICPEAFPHLTFASTPTFVQAAVARNPWLASQIPSPNKGLLEYLLPTSISIEALSRFFQGPLQDWNDAASAAKRARLSEILECPVCCDRVRGKVQQCRHGHIFCSECIARMPGEIFVCPICRDRQPKLFLSRSLVAESCARA